MQDLIQFPKMKDYDATTGDINNLAKFANNFEVSPNGMLIRQKQKEIN